MEPSSPLPPISNQSEARSGPVQALSNLFYRHSRLAVVTMFALLGAGLAAASLASTNPVTTITVDGNRPGAEYMGIGAISGGGGDSRYLVDYPEPERDQIFNYLFRPNFGANLQMLKIEIGGDSNSTDGAEPSIEPAPGQINCNAGYEWTIAAQAEALNPKIKLYGLQWAAPGWVGDSVWTQKDVNYVIDWMNCAKSHRLTISYLGGWNERDYNASWYKEMRQALDANGYKDVQLMADDEIGGRHWAIADAVASDPALSAAVGVVGVHDTCQFPTTGYTCTSTATAKGLKQPLWESEVGKLFVDTYGNTGAGANWVRTVNNSYNQASVTGLLQWPIVESAPPSTYSNRGLLTADNPWSGQYAVNQLTWATAQTTQFVPAGWDHVNGANQPLGSSGSYNTYEAADKTGWAVVAENTGTSATAKVIPQDIKVNIIHGQPSSKIWVRETNLASKNPADWFVALPDIHPTNGSFIYTIPAGYVVTFGTQSADHGVPVTPPPTTAVPMPLPYTATEDVAQMPIYFAPQEGSFEYAPCAPGRTGSCIQQMAPQTPVFWTHSSVGSTPYGIVGDPSWQNYTVSADVYLTSSSATVGLIGHYANQNQHTKANFDGYDFSLNGSGTWTLSSDTSAAGPTAIHSGALVRNGKAITSAAGNWHSLSLSFQGTTLTASIDGSTVSTATAPTSAPSAGLAGLESSWDNVQYTNFSVK